MKVRKGKRSDHPVDEEDEEGQPAPEPQVEDDEYNLQDELGIFSSTCRQSGHSLMTNTRMIGFINGTKTCHGYTKSHGWRMEYGKNQVQNGRALKNAKLKEEALRNKAIIEGLINEDVESNEGWKSWDDFENTNGDRNEGDIKMNIKMMKDMSYVTMDRFGNKNGVLKLKEGMDGPRCKEIDEVGEISIIWNPMCDCSDAGIQTHV
ncbi:hypothetical protein Tco_0483999 [Tanacetum coccineum]